MFRKTKKTKKSDVESDAVPEIPRQKKGEPGTVKSEEQSTQGTSQTPARSRGSQKIESLAKQIDKLDMKQEKKTSPVNETPKKSNKPEYSAKQEDVKREKKTSPVNETPKKKPREGPFEPGPFSYIFEGLRAFPKLKPSINISNASNVHIGNKNIYQVTQVQNIGRQKEPELDPEQFEARFSPGRTKQKEVPPEIKCAFNYTDQLEWSDIDHIKETIVDGKKLQQRLWTDEIGDFDLVKPSHEQVVLWVLHEWAEYGGRNATVGILIKELWDAEEENAAKKLAELYAEDVEDEEEEDDDSK